MKIRPPASGCHGQTETQGCPWNAAHFRTSEGDNQRALCARVSEAGVGITADGPP
jgi:hypothetical protein